MLSIGMWFHNSHRKFSDHVIGQQIWEMVVMLIISLIQVIQLAKIAQVIQVIDNIITVTWNFANERA